MKEIIYLFTMIATLIIFTLSCSKKKPPESSKPVEPAPLSSPVPKPSPATPMRIRRRRRRGRYPLTELEDVEEDVKTEKKKELGDENEGWIREEDYLARIKKEGKNRVEPEDHRTIEKFDGEVKKSRKSEKSKKSEKKKEVIPMPPIAKEQLTTNGSKPDKDYMPIPDIKSDWGSEKEKKKEAEEEKNDEDYV
ncbi:hypothetical protein B9Z55_016025 [Caenorhabditis nigoni]|nr:hypothetical protein B9Z55_016025 [Caenorhabditis nigoni]